MASEIKLKNVKFFNSVRLSNVENFYYHDEKVDITLDGIIVTLVDKHTKDSICATLMNVVSFSKQHLQTAEPNEKGSKK